MRTFLILVFSLLLVASQPAAATPLDHLPALKGDYFLHQSKAVGRPFHIYVRLPQDYAANPSKQYPVVYLLDGDSLFPILAANHLFIHFDENLPEAIVIGIAYGSFDPAINKRGYDFSAPAADATADQGGAPAFHAFLKDELLPAVEVRYRADPNRRVLFGNSRGGYFVLWSAFTDPNLFWGRIVSNPSLTPGRELFFSAPALASRKDLGLVFSTGTRDRQPTRDNALAFFTAWEGKGGLPWRLNLQTIEGGTHAADATNVYRKAMLWLFAQR